MAEQKTSPRKKVDKYKYLPGFGSHLTSEALPDALPKGQNSPQECPYGLYAEQLSGTAFTVPRDRNQRRYVVCCRPWLTLPSWFYRILPSANHLPMKPAETLSTHLNTDFSKCVPHPNQLRWRPFPVPQEPTDFVQGLITIAGAGEPSTKTGLAVHYYTCNTSMKDKSFQNSDGDFLIGMLFGTNVVFVKTAKVALTLFIFCSARTRYSRYPNRIWFFASV